MNNVLKGKIGEALALEYLQAKGYRVIAQNYRCGKSEIDIICAEGDTIVFVEVKARSNSKFGSGLEAISSRKQQMLVRGAYGYLAEKGLLDSKVRFDAIEVDLAMNTIVNHIKNAFVEE